MGLLALKRGLRFKVFEREFQERACIGVMQAIAYGISFCECQPFCRSKSIECNCQILSLLSLHLLVYFLHFKSVFNYRPGV
jgi:hypothetical protein